MTDNQEKASTWAMPNLNALIVSQGATFDRFYYTQSSCCPSRTTILRGQYPHNHQIHSISFPHGGWRKVFSLGLEASTIATWMQSAGYTTSYIGKYLNEFEFSAPSYIPPGWNDWHVHRSAPGTTTQFYYNYKLNENGVTVSYGTGAAHYSTDVFANLAVRFINSQAAAAQPFFLVVSPNPPNGRIPAARHLGRFSTAPLPRPPNFNEADVSDKPQWVRNNPLMTATVISQQTGNHRKRLETLLAADDLIKQVVDALAATGQLDNTYILFTSDNGFHIGQHRLIRDRNSAYEEDNIGPLFIRGPGVPAGAVLSHPVLTNDFAPTFAELAGAQVPTFVDGRSLVPLLSGSPPAVSSWRQVFSIEYNEPPPNIYVPPVYFAIRTDRHTYVEYSTGEKELYDNQTDPYQLTNLATTADPVLLETLSQRLNAIRTCAGILCRAEEDVPGPP